VGAGNRGCNQATGSLKVLDVGFDAQGAVSRLWALFDHHCEGRRSSAFGEVRRRAWVPESAAQVTPAVLRWPVLDSWWPAASLFLQNRDDNHDWWQLRLYAGGGQKLQPGAGYPDAQGNADGPGPGVDVSGRPAWCDQTAGAFTVHAISYLPDGRRRSFDTSFERRCYADERLLDCGPGRRDRVVAGRGDRVRNCERRL
jgi:hypothetical protein